jgi:hypothetical protein
VARSPDKENDPPMKDSRSPDPTSPAPVGARHDDSSLFTLDALKKTEDEARQQKRNDDSGLIDLKALAAIAAERPKETEVAVASVIAPPDLFTIAVPVVPMIAPPIITTAPEVAKPKPNRTGIFVGMGVAVAAVAAIGVFMATRGPAAAAASATPVAAALPPAPTAAAAPQPDEPKLAAVNPGERAPKEDPPKPTATATAATAPKAAVPVARGPMPKAAPKEDAPPAPPKPPADACDLACQMQRAVNKKK